MPRRPTSADVARAAGVSRTTVSFVLNGRRDVKIPEETRRRVLAAADSLGYHPHAPARQLAGGRSHSVALVLRQTPEQIAGDAVLAETLRGFATSARADGYRVMVEPLPPDGPHATYAELLRAQHAGLSAKSKTAKAIDYLLKRWPAFTRFLDDGRICLSNNAAERALRGIAMAYSLYPPSSSTWKH